MRSFNKMNN